MPNVLVRALAVAALFSLIVKTRLSSRIGVSAARQKTVVRKVSLKGDGRFKGFDYCDERVLFVSSA